MKRFFICPCLLACMSAQAAAPIREIQPMLAKPTVLCGRFDQSKQLTGLKKPLASNGRFCVVAGKGVVVAHVAALPQHAAFDAR